jgi:hypothetical protein
MIQLRDLPSQIIHAKQARRSVRVEGSCIIARPDAANLWGTSFRSGLRLVIFGLASIAVEFSIYAYLSNEHVQFLLPIFFVLAMNDLLVRDLSIG